MESPHGKQKVIFLTCIPLLFLFCRSPDKPEAIAWNFDFLKSGDLIYRQGNGYFSNYFRKFSESENLYSHVGVICKMADSVFVIHAEASELTGVGYVRKDALPSFLEGIQEWAIYRIKTDENRRSAISALAWQFHLKKIPFDVKFDAADTTAFYCTELVANCVNKSLDKPIIIANTQRNGKRFIAIDDTYLNEAIELIFSVSRNKLSMQGYLYNH